MLILDWIRIHFKNALSSIWHRDSLFEHQRLTGAENLLHVTIIANGRAPVEYLIAKFADQLLFVQVKEPHKSFIDLENAKLPVIDGKRGSVTLSKTLVRNFSS